MAQAESARQIAALEERQKIVGVSSAERRKLRESVRQAEEKARLSRTDLNRQRQLFKEEIVSQADLDKSESQYRQDYSA